MQTMIETKYEDESTSLGGRGRSNLCLRSKHSSLALLEGGLHHIYMYISRDDDTFLAEPVDKNYNSVSFDRGILSS
jgi:hypothetical protein